jgi:pilus assembly protein CpaB
MSAFLPQPAQAGDPIVVVSRDLMAGHVLTRDDLAVTDWPASLSPEGAVADPEALLGRALGAGMSRGEPMTAARVRGPGLLTGVPVGFVAAHVRLTDPAMAAMAAPGDHVDLISATGRLVAPDVAVLAVDAASTGGGGWSASSGSGLPGGVVVAVTKDAAMLLATVDPSGLAETTFSLVMRPAGT